MIQKGQEVKVDLQYYGVVSGYAIADNHDGETTLYYVVKLGDGVWSEGRGLYLSMILAHPDNVKEV